MKTSEDYLADPVVAVAVAGRRSFRGHRRLQRSLIFWHATWWYMQSHGFYEDEYISPELLERFKWKTHLDRIRSGFLMHVAWWRARRGLVQGYCSLFPRVPFARTKNQKTDFKFLNGRQK